MAGEFRLKRRAVWRFAAIMVVALALGLMFSARIASNARAAQREQVAPAVCGNGTCETGESASTCPADCSSTATTGGTTTGSTDSTAPPTSTPGDPTGATAGTTTAGGTTTSGTTDSTTTSGTTTGDAGTTDGAAPPDAGGATTGDAGTTGGTTDSAAPATTGTTTGDAGTTGGTTDSTAPNTTGGTTTSGTTTGSATTAGGTTGSTALTTGGTTTTSGTTTGSDPAQPSDTGGGDSGISRLDPRRPDGSVDPMHPSMLALYAIVFFFAAVAIPSFMKNARKAKTAEATGGGNVGKKRFRRTLVYPRNTDDGEQASDDMPTDIDAGYNHPIVMAAVKEPRPASHFRLSLGSHESGEEPPRSPDDIAINPVQEHIKKAVLTVRKAGNDSNDYGEEAPDSPDDLANPTDSAEAHYGGGMGGGKVNVQDLHYAQDPSSSGPAQSGESRPIQIKGGVQSETPADSIGMDDPGGESASQGNVKHGNIKLTRASDVDPDGGASE